MGRSPEPAVSRELITRHGDFMATPQDRQAYKTTLARALVPGGRAIIGTFSPRAPETCSGLRVNRYSPDLLMREFAGLLVPLEHRTETHRTPWGAPQEFTSVVFERRPAVTSGALDSHSAS